MDYGTITHHSNQDVYEHIRAEDLKQAAVIIACFVYNTAMRDEMIPRKPIRPEEFQPPHEPEGGAEKKAEPTPPPANPVNPAPPPPSAGQQQPNP
jgi:hypothetical protein